MSIVVNGMHGLHVHSINDTNHRFQAAYEAMTFDDPSLHVLQVIGETGDVAPVNIVPQPPAPNVDASQLFDQASTGVTTSEIAGDKPHEN